MNRERKNAGFSLIELIIILAIMSILIGVISPSLLRYVEKTREAKRISDADAFRRCYELASIDVMVHQGISPSKAGNLNIRDNALSFDPAPENNAYNQALMDELNTTYTNDYVKENITNISLKYTKTGEIIAIYLHYVDGSKTYDYAYKCETGFLYAYEEINGDWYKKKT